MSRAPSRIGVPPPPPDLRPAPRPRRLAAVSGSSGVVLLLAVVAAAAVASTAILVDNPAAGPQVPPATDSAIHGPATGTSAMPTLDRAAASPGSSAAQRTPVPPATDDTDPTPDPLPALVPKEPAPTSAPPEELTGYVWPLRDARITSRFGPRSFGNFVVVDGDEIHDGLDLATYCGNKVRAAHDGTVLYAGRKFDDFMGYLGPSRSIYQRLERQGRLKTLPIVVVIDDGNGYRSVYVHLSKASVDPGQEVKAGDVIGEEGATGYATGCHLHYALIRMDGPWQVVVPSLHPFGYPAFVRERIDPLLVLPKDHPDAPVRLRNRFASPSPEPSPLTTLSPASPSPAASPAASPAGTSSPSPAVTP